MTDLSVLIVAGIVVVLLGFLSAYAALVLFSTRTRPASDDAPRALSFLFSGPDLVDADPAAEAFLSEASPEGSDWDRLLSRIGAQFPDLASAANGPPDQAPTRMQSRSGDYDLTLDVRAETLRVDLIPTDAIDPAVDPIAHATQARELGVLRAIADASPFLIWTLTEDGRVTWANRAYIDCLDAVADRDTIPVWPLPCLFERATLDQAVESRATRRIRLDVPGETVPRWYECSGSRIDDQILFTAVDARATVQAESQLRDFMQTLTQTFSHLTTGIAIFDRTRRLVLFNPALTDLMSLPVEFLTGRPQLAAFLDRLRDMRMIPEPRDYRGWQRQLTELEASAASGTYCETWSLPSGQTYRITGRPHAGGALALLFEDISSEVGLTRKFRAEIELGQSLADSFPEALAVFTSNGRLAFTNKAHRTLWGIDPDARPADITITEATRLWMERCAATPVWGELRDFILHSREREEWDGEIRLKDGRAVALRVAPLAGGATLVGFSEPARISGRPKGLVAEV